MSTQTANTAKPTSVVTGETRFSYAHVWKPSAMNEGDEPKYSVSILISKSDTKTLARVKAAIDAATEDGISSKWGGKKPAKFLHPLRDGDEEKSDDPTYANCYFISAKSKNKPTIYNRTSNGDLVVMTDEDDFYSGCYGLAKLNFFPFDNKSKGVACGLNGLVKTRDGEALDGAKVSADDFAAELAELPETESFLG